MHCRMLLLVSLLLAGQSLLPAETTGPNLLILHTDEHHYNTLGCYGSKIVRTPHIDWLAEQGARCTSFYATTPVCSPSRAALVTGRYPHTTPVATNNIPLDDEMITFAQVLQNQGYATGYIGKWHLDGDGKPQWAPRRHFGFTDNRYMFNRGHWKMFDLLPDGPRVAARDKKDRPTYGIDGVTPTSFSTDWLTDRSLEFLQEHADESFCLMVSYPDPHGPNTVRAPYSSLFNKRDVLIPASFTKTEQQTPKWAGQEKDLTAQKLRQLMPAYYGMVRCIDDNVGRILALLRRQQRLEKTMILFCSDHGDLCGEHGRLNKGNPYEGSARIPFLMYYPAKVPAGLVIDEALSCVDVMPTMLSLLDQAGSGQEQGRNASALFQGQSIDGWHDVTILRSTPGRTNWLCAVSDRYKLVYSNVDDPWLFDLKADPDELWNIYAEENSQEIVQTFSAALKKYCQLHDDPYGEDPQIARQITEGLNR